MRDEDANQSPGATSRVWCVNTSAGLHAPDQWLLFEGDQGGCSVPTEAAGFEHIWDQLKQRFDGFDYKPLIEHGRNDTKHLCWDRTWRDERAQVLP
jgi:hypothetical protein